MLFPKKIKLLLTIIIITLINKPLLSQNKYWIYLKDKQGTVFNPLSYFDQKTLQRRMQYNIQFDSTDFPINYNYYKTIELLVFEITGISRWFNAVAVKTDENQILQIRLLPFVLKVEKMSTKTIYSQYNFPIPIKNQLLIINQTERMQGSLFSKNKIKGYGIRIAIFDGGFPGVESYPAFEHLRKVHKIIKTFDFTRKKEFVYGYNSHGTMVLSCIAGLIDTINLGLATEAEFLLARTELNSEPFAEEEYWLEAAEWADKNGADIINSSLGYIYHRYFPEQMDGKTSLIARAANLAARKGILVINAMGNEGDTRWKTLDTPADADSVLSIGGIDPVTDYHIDFSSFGPTADKRLKPNLCAFATAIVAGKNRLIEVQGTSFSTPLVTGFAACAWQLNRNLTNMELLKKLENSGDLYPYFDYAHGYGVPQASYFFGKSKKKELNTFEIEIDDDKIILKVDWKYIDFENNKNYLYYHIQNKDGFVEKYSLIEVYGAQAFIINKSEQLKGKILRAHYKGCTREIMIK